MKVQILMEILQEKLSEEQEMAFQKELYRVSHLM
jgi:hypothetical protein